jgi:hypothetical protein
VATVHLGARSRPPVSAGADELADTSETGVDTVPRTDEQRQRDRENRAERHRIAYQDARSAILDVFSTARHFHMTHSKIVERLSTRRAMRPKILTAYDRAKLSGFEDAMWHHVETKCLDWRLTLPDGSWIDAREYPYKDVDCTSYDMQGCHFWRGTDAPYGEPSSMNQQNRSK